MGNLIWKVKQKIREEITFTQNKEAVGMTSHSVPGLFKKICS
jgi:hypothetical protein